MHNTWLHYHLSQPCHLDRRRSRSGEIPAFPGDNIYAAPNSPSASPIHHA